MFALPSSASITSNSTVHLVYRYQRKLFLLEPIKFELPCKNSVFGILCTHLSLINVLKENFETREKTLGNIFIHQKVNYRFFTHKKDLTESIDYRDVPALMDKFYNKTCTASVVQTTTSMPQKIDLYFTGRSVILEMDYNTRQFLINTPTDSRFAHRPKYHEACIHKQV